MRIRIIVALVNITGGVLDELPIVADMTPGSPVAIEAFTADMKVWKSGGDESGHCFGIRGRNVGMFEFDHVGSAMLFLFSFLLYFFLFL